MANCVAHMAGQIGVPLYRRKEPRHVSSSASGRARTRRLRVHTPVRGGDSLCFYTFYFFYTFSVGEKSNKRWNSNVFIAFFSYTFTLVYSFCMLKRVTNVGIPTFLLTLLHLFLSLEGRAPSKILPNRWNHWDFLRFPSLWKSRKVYVPTSTAMVPLPGMVIL